MFFSYLGKLDRRALKKLAKLFACLTLLYFPASISKTFSTISQATQVEATNTYSNIALYDYLLGDYFKSLTEVELAQHHGFISNDIHVKMRLANLYRYFDMETPAFALLDKNQQSISLDDYNEQYQASIWFSLAQQFYLKGNYLAAKQALTNLGASVPDKQQDDFYFLKAQLSLRTDEAEQINEAKSKLMVTSIYNRYLDYNVAMTALTKGELDNAIIYLNKVTDVFPDMEFSEVVIALFDKAHLSLGYTYIQSNAYQKAINAFKKVSLEGLAAESAMLGYGLAASKLNDFQTALAVWQRLSERSKTTAFVREAFIAIPYAYEQLNDRKSAYQAYELALNKFLEQKNLLDLEIQKTASEGYIEAMMVQAPVIASEVPGKQPIKTRGVTLSLPSSINTYDVVASNSFQQGIRDLNDLNSIINQIELWRTQLDSWETEETVSLALYNAADAEFTQVNAKVFEKLAAAKGLKNKLLNDLIGMLAEKFTTERDSISGYIQTTKIKLAKFKDDIFIENNQKSLQLTPENSMKNLQSIRPQESQRLNSDIDVLGDQND